MSFLSMLEEMPVFGEFDTIKNTPVVSFDVRQLVQTVGLLWENAKKQRFLMEAMEREMAKRKTETEVRLRTMQSDLEGQIRNESKRREQEDESIRAEIDRLKNHVDTGIKTVGDEAKTRDEDLQRSADRANGILRGTLLETEGKVMDLAGDIEELRKSIAGLRSAPDTGFDTERVMKAIDNKHSLICTFIGTTPEDLSSAVASHRSKDTFLKVPALADLSGQIKTAESIANAALEDAKHLAKKVADITRNVTDLTVEVERNGKAVVESEMRVTDGYGDGDKRLHKRIDDLTSRVSSISSTPGIVQPPSEFDGSVVSSLRDELSELAKRVRKVESELEDKASTREMALKAALVDLEPIWEAINRLLGLVDTHGLDITELKSRKVISEPVRKYIEPSPPREDPRLSEILTRLGDAERMCKHLDDVKADKTEVNAALKDLMKRVEKALNALLARIQDLESLSMPSEATAGRFRCLSCNRNAGPLQEQLTERMSSPQFPPSNVYVQSRPHSASARPSQVVVPGVKDYGGGMTSSRKKLMNYYTWLQDRADSPHKSNQSERPERSRSPSLKHPWPGAQSGNGEAGERQCGDKGSAEPEAIGSDGKYYVGVLSRPQSATRRVDVNL